MMIGPWTPAVCIRQLGVCHVFRGNGAAGAGTVFDEETLLETRLQLLRDHTGDGVRVPLAA